jgi:hypothetical protein
MKSKFNYTGEVTIQTVFNNKTVCTQHLNSGTPLLFEAYARALVGQNIYELLPSFLNIYYTDDKGEKSLIRNPKGASVIRTLEKANKGTNTTLITRLSTSITKDMMDLTNVDGSSYTVELKLLTDIVSSQSQEVLANVLLSDVDSETFIESMKDTPASVQLIVVWDLYISNNEDKENDE